jgi:hypothetical protein
MALDRKIVARELLEATKLIATRPIRIDRRIAEKLALKGIYQAAEDFLANGIKP